jgi:protein ImuB
VSAPISPARTLVVRCPNWSVTALGHSPSSLAAVEEAGRLSAASLAARRLGVRPGQRRREAQARCPELVVGKRDEAAERRAFEPVVRALEAFGPAVALGAPGWAAMRIRGPARYFGGERAFAMQVAEALGELLGPSPLSEAEASLVAPCWQIGVADGPFAATIAAKTGRIVPSAETAAFLSPVSIDEIGDGELVDLLRRLGVYSLGAFGALDERDVLARFGVQGARLHALARGSGESALAPRPTAQPFVADLVPDPPIARVDEAAFAVRSLAADLAHQLSVGGLACTLLEIAVSFTDGDQVVRRWSHDGSFAASLIAERLRFQLEAFLLRRATGETGEEILEERGITHLRLEAVEVGADLGRAFELWGRPAFDEDRVGRTFARLQGIAGAEAVLRPFLVGGRGPADQVVFVPYGEAPPSAEALADAPWPGRLPPPSPTIVGDGGTVAVRDGEGLPISIGARGQMTAPPAVVDFGGDAAVAGRPWGGPWPIDGHWWEPRRRRRRARIEVLLEDGQALLLSLEQGRWQVEGRWD